LMDRPGNVVFRIHYNGVFHYDPLSLDIDSGGLKLIESDANVHALYDLAEKSPPLKSRPFRNDMMGRVLFTDMYCVEYEGFEMTPPLKNVEVDLEGMSEGKNDASKYVEYTQGVQGVTDGINEGMNDESESDHSDKSFDYLSNCKDVLIEHRKRMIQSKVNGAEVLDEVLFYEVPHAASDEGRSAQERSNKEKIVAKCGQSKEIIKDPSKGKQRAFKKYPSNNAQKSSCN
nr:pentatricopeptide repeat-containing protein [Tanacetum cinerariifolium]